MRNSEYNTPQEISDAIDRLPDYEMSKFSESDCAVAEPLLKNNGILWNDEFMDFYEDLIKQYGKEYVNNTRLRHILGGSNPHPEILKFALDTKTSDFQNFIKYMSEKLRDAA